MTNGLSIVSFGNTGRVGTGFLSAALDDERVERIYLVNRREVAELGDPRVVYLTMTNFESGYEAVFADLDTRIDLVHWSLGGPPSLTRLRGQGSLYHDLHVAFPTIAAEFFARKNREVVFHYASGAMVGEGKWPDFRHEKAVAERLVAEKCAALSYRPRLVLPVGKRNWLPSFMAIPSQTYGAFVLDAHFRLREGTVEPGTAFEHGQMVG